MAKPDNRGRDEHKRGGGKAHKPAAAKGPTQRMLRVGEMIRHKLAEMLARGEIHDDVLGRAVITVPEVRLATDLKYATVYVMPLGGKDIPGVLAALERNKKYIRSEVAHAVNLKYAPDLKFRADETFAEADRIGRIMSSPKVRQDIAKADAEEPGEPGSEK